MLLTCRRFLGFSAVGIAAAAGSFWPKDLPPLADADALPAENAALAQKIRTPTKEAAFSAIR